jgi:hypothetical protein
MFPACAAIKMLECWVARRGTPFLRPQQKTHANAQKRMTRNAQS